MAWDKSCRMTEFRTVRTRKPNDHDAPQQSSKTALIVKYQSQLQGQAGAGLATSVEHQSKHIDNR